MPSGVGNTEGFARSRRVVPRLRRRHCSGFDTSIHRAIAGTPIYSIFYQPV